MPGMLLLLQAAQHLPPIYVTVQQPSGGMPEWAKLIITASVGAVFGIGTSVFMEFVKPFIAKRQLKKIMTSHLVSEAITLLSNIEACIRMCELANEGHQELEEEAMTFSRILLRDGCSGDRYEFYLNEQKALVYEVDVGHFLAHFHLALRYLRTDRHSFVELREALSDARLYGQKFFEDQKIMFHPAYVVLESLAEGRIKAARNKVMLESSEPSV